MGSNEETVGPVVRSCSTKASPVAGCSSMSARSKKHKSSTKSLRLPSDHARGPPTIAPPNSLCMDAVGAAPRAFAYGLERAANAHANGAGVGGSSRAEIPQRDVDAKAEASSARSMRRRESRAGVLSRRAGASGGLAELATGKVTAGASTGEMRDSGGGRLSSSTTALQSSLRNCVSTRLIVLSLVLPSFVRR